MVGRWTYNELDCDSGHQGAEKNDADGLDPCPALHSCQATELSSLYEDKDSLRLGTCRYLGARQVST